MRIAVFQNFLDTIGGAEVVGLTMARELGADIYTTNVDEEKIRNMGFADVLPRVFSIGRVPLNAPYRQQAVLWRFSRLRLAGAYDFFIINGDWAVSAAARNKPNLWYVNATIRELWDLRDYVRNDLLPAWRRPIFDVWSLYNRHLNRKHIRQADAIAANSAFTRMRVWKYLGRDSQVIHPPVETARLRRGKDGGYWLSVNRLVPYKQVEMQMRAFARLPEEKLVIIGPYERSKASCAYARFIQGLCPPNVTLIEKADDRDKLAAYYADCKGFITTCRQEDYGITAVEAMACGKPVIAPDEGGYRETVKDGETGMLIEGLNEDKLAAAVRTLGQKLESPEIRDRFGAACQERARRFDTQAFISKLKKTIGQRPG